MRILIGHQNTALPVFDTERFDVRVVQYGKDGSRPPTTISEMREQCPPGWQPDVYYHLALVHFPIPTDIEDFEGLTVTDVQDWHQGGRPLWATSGFFDLIVTERNAVELLQAGGYENARFTRFWGVDPNVQRIMSGVERDIDILFIGSLHGEIWAERNRWIDRLARLSDRYRILIASGHYGEDYIRLMNRAKIVFNRSVNGCTNGRAYDGPACGALVFNEAENEETREIFEDRVHCVYYNQDNFEDLLAHYLTHEDERARIVEAGRRKVLAEHTASLHLDQMFARIEASRERQGYRPLTRRSAAERHVRKAFQMYCGTYPVAAMTALELLDAAEKAGWDRAKLLEARAALTGWMAHSTPAAERIRMFTSAITYARDAIKAAPKNALAQMALGFLLLERAEATGGAHPTGKNDIIEAAVALSAAAEQCESGVVEGRREVDDIDGFGYPRWNDLFDSRIERAYLMRDVAEIAWAEEMRRTIAWRCRSMLSDLAAANDQREEALRQAEAAAAILPTEADALLRLARNQAMTGHLTAAIDNYIHGLAISPLTHAAWPELATLLTATGQRAEAEAFVAERLRVIQAVPSLAGMRPLLEEALRQG